MVPGHHPRWDLTPARGLRCGFVSETPGPARTIQVHGTGSGWDSKRAQAGAAAGPGSVPEVFSPEVSLHASPQLLFRQPFITNVCKQAGKWKDSGRDASLPTTSTLPLTFYCTCSLRSPVAGLPALWAPAARTSTSPPDATASFTPDDGSGFVYGSLYSLEMRTYRQ